MISDLTLVYSGGPWFSAVGTRFCKGRPEGQRGVTILLAEAAKGGIADVVEIVVLKGGHGGRDPREGTVDPLSLYC